MNFKKNTGKEYPRIKFKHKWDTLKKDWVACVSLKVLIPINWLINPRIFM